MNKLIKFLSASAFTLAVLFIFAGSNFASAVPMYVKIGDIKGESTDSDHKDWIIIESMSSPLAQAAATSGKRQHKPFSITKAVDKSSPMLQRALASGQKFPEVFIAVQNSDNKRQPYLTYRLKDVIVTSLESNSSGSAAGDRTVQTEMVSLSYSSIELVKDKPGRATVRKD